MDKRKKGVWSLFTDHVEWWQNYLTEISVLVVGLGLTYWGEHAVHRSAQGGREPPLPQAGVSGFRLSGGTEQGCMKKKQLSITENCFCVKPAVVMLLPELAFIVSEATGLFADGLKGCPGHFPTELVSRQMSH